MSDCAACCVQLDDQEAVLVLTDASDLSGRKLPGGLRAHVCAPYANANQYGAAKAEIGWKHMRCMYA